MRHDYVAEHPWVSSASKRSAGFLLFFCGTLLHQALGGFLFEIFPRVPCFAHLRLSTIGRFAPAHRRILNLLRESRHFGGPRTQPVWLSPLPPGNLEVQEGSP